MVELMFRINFIILQLLVILFTNLLCDIWDEELLKVIKTDSLRDRNISLSESKTKLLLLLFTLTSKLNLGISGIRLNNVPLECLEL